jgi:hypothetical protein
VVRDRRLGQPNRPGQIANTRFPGTRYEDWVLEDPAELDVDAVRPIRDQIRERVQRLASELVPT